MTALEYALRYANKGWAVFPVHSIKNGRCTCRNQDCGHPGKHPLTKKGFKDATTDVKAIETWWGDKPWANVAIATGTPSSLFVVDIDIGPNKDGFATLAQLEQKYGKIPFSERVRTGSGGLQIYFHAPDCQMGSTVERLGHAIDTRGNGGYVVAPPSMHISGKKYVWETPNDE